MIPIPAASVIAFIMEREILRLYDAMSGADRHFLMLYAFHLTEPRGEGAGRTKRGSRAAASEMNMARLRRILADASPAETELIYRQARRLEDKKKTPERDNPSQA